MDTVEALNKKQAGSLIRKPAAAAPAAKKAAKKAKKKK